jgi:hypothetical protein
MRTAERILATRLWCRYALRVSGAASRDEFINKFESFASPKTGYGLDPRLLSAWEDGRRCVSEGMVHRVNSQVAGTRSVFAIAALLDRKRVSAPAARRAVQDLYTTLPDGSRLWALPRAGLSEVTDDGVQESDWADAAALASRGDFPGFLAIMTLLRESAATTDCGRIEQRARALYTALPAVAKLGWVRPDVDLLLQCIEDMMVGIRWISAATLIDWDAFRAQISIPRPWQGDPPWIVRTSGGLTGGSSPRLLRRPVPLLDDVVPLWRYVRPPKANDIPRPERARASRLWGLFGDYPESSNRWRN